MSIKQVNTLANTELLLTTLSDEQWLSWIKTHQHKNIFFGVGIMTSRAMSNAVPFDILAMIFISEVLRQTIGGEKVIVLIADQHAITNKLVSIDKINQITQDALRTVSNITSSFNLNHFEIIQTTPLNSNHDIRKIFGSLPEIPNEYLKHEIADTIWLQKHHNVGVKLGWSMSKNDNVQGHDERFFDTQISKFASNISFIHTKSGRTADAKRQRVSPYVSIEGEDRLLLNDQEDAVSKIDAWRKQKSNLAIKPLLRHISQILRLHDKIFDPMKFISFEEKVQTLINKSVHAK